MSSRIDTLPRKELKMWLVIRKDLELSKGKLAVQSGHAFVGLALKAMRKKPILTWRYLFSGATPKISLAVNDLHDLNWVRLSCVAHRIPFHVVVDAGRTEIEAGTTTVLAFGPAYRDDLPKDLINLKLYKD